MATEIMRQLELEFDYSGFTKESTGKLESIAKEIDYLREKSRVDSVTDALLAAGILSVAKQEFKETGDGTWARWCTERLQISRSSADKAIRVHKVLGKKDGQDLAGLPVNRLYAICQEKTPAKLRAVILKRAKKYLLSDRDVDQLLGSADDGQVSFGASVPKDHEELKGWFEKKARNMAKRIGKELADEIPEVLRELAQELNGATK
jgi:hypothetical protein